MVEAILRRITPEETGGIRLQLAIAIPRGLFFPHSCSSTVYAIMKTERGEYNTTYRKLPFAALGFWSFKFVAGFFGKRKRSLWGYLVNDWVAAIIVTRAAPSPRRPQSSQWPRNLLFFAFLVFGDSFSLCLVCFQFRFLSSFSVSGSALRRSCPFPLCWT